MNFLKAVILSTVAIASMAFSQVNINTASAEELTALSGIGPKKAAEIIKYRRANGKFKSVQELINVTGIGEATVNNLGRDAKVSGRTDVTKVSKGKAKSKSTKESTKAGKTSTKKSSSSKADKAKTEKAKVSKTQKTDKAKTKPSKSEKRKVEKNKAKKSKVSKKTNKVKKETTKKTAKKKVKKSSKK